MINLWFSLTKSGRLSFPLVVRVSVVEKGWVDVDKSEK